MRSCTWFCLKNLQTSSNQTSRFLLQKFWKFAVGMRRCASTVIRSRRRGTGSSRSSGGSSFLLFLCSLDYSSLKDITFVGWAWLWKHWCGSYMSWHSQGWKNSDLGGHRCCGKRPWFVMLIQFVVSILLFHLLNYLFFSSKLDTLIFGSICIFYKSNIILCRCGWREVCDQLWLPWCCRRLYPQVSFKTYPLSIDPSCTLNDSVMLGPANIFTYSTTTLSSGLVEQGEKATQALPTPFSPRRMEKMLRNLSTYSRRPTRYIVPLLKKFETLFKTFLIRLWTQSLWKCSRWGPWAMVVVVGEGATYYIILDICYLWWNVSLIRKVFSHIVLFISLS